MQRNILFISEAPTTVVRFRTIFTWTWRITTNCHYKIAFYFIQRRLETVDSTIIGMKTLNPYYFASSFGISLNKKHYRGSKNSLVLQPHAPCRRKDKISDFGPGTAKSPHNVVNASTHWTFQYGFSQTPFGSGFDRRCWLPDSHKFRLTIQ